MTAGDSVRDAEPFDGHCCNSVGTHAFRDCTAVFFSPWPRLSSSPSGSDTPDCSPPSARAKNKLENTHGYPYAGNLRCWGDAQFGGLGSGDETDTGDGTVVADLVDLGGSSPVTAVGEGPCAVFEDGGMRCWGKGYYGQNGQGTAQNIGDVPGEMGSALPTVSLGAGRLAHSVAGGRDFNCAVLQDGDIKVGVRVWCATLLFVLWRASGG